MAAIAFSENLSFQGDRMDWQTYNASTVTITGTTIANRVSLGGASDEISGAQGAKYIDLEVTLDINQANNVRILLYGLEASGGTEFRVPYRHQGAAEAEYYEITDDSDHSRVITWQVDKAYDYYIFYAYMGTDGGTDPAITLSKVALSK